MLLELLEITKFSLRLPQEPGQNFVTLIPLMNVFQVLAKPVSTNTSTILQ